MTSNDVAHLEWCEGVDPAHKWELVIVHPNGMRWTLLNAEQPLKILNAPETGESPALALVLQEHKRLRSALAKISCGTDDLLPPFRAIGVDGLRAIARKALAEVQDRPAVKTSGGTDNG